MIVVPIGTKGMLIKMIGVIRELDRAGLEYCLISLSEHGETLDKVRKMFGIREFDLKVRNTVDIGNAYEIIVWLTKCLKSILANKIREIDIILIQGDTLSSLISLYWGIGVGKRIAHIEAGLRSGDMFNPFPEEVIRCIIDRFSDILYAPTVFACKNLRNEGVRGEIVYTRGNTIRDAIEYALRMQPLITPPIERFVLISIHRVENIFSTRRMELLCEVIRYIVENTNLLPVWVLHKSTRMRLMKLGLYPHVNKRVKFMRLLDYVSFIHFMKKAEFIITDGGGPQEESFYLGTPCLIFRKRTERIEGLGWNVKVSGYDFSKIVGFINSYHILKKRQIISSSSPSRVIVKDILQRVRC